MIEQDIINELSLMWAGKTAVEIASSSSIIVGGLIDTIPEAEHLAVGHELRNQGIVINHNENEVIASAGICKRKKAPNP